MKIPMRDTRPQESILKRFRRENSGMSAVVFALMMVPMLGVVGVALDFSRANSLRGKLQAAADAAALAAGKKYDGTETERRKIAQDVFKANAEHLGFVNTYTLVYTDIAKGDGARVDVSADIPTTISGILGINTVEVAVRAETVIGGADMEIALVLDVTGSMGGQKIQDLKAAASEAVDILLPTTNASGKTRISLVPYSSAVNAGPYAKKASSNPSFECVTERGGSQKFSDASPNSGKMGAASSYCPAQSVVPLNYDPAVLKSTINSFQASGSTAGHLGVAWSYYTLSPKWGGIWPAKAKPANYKAPKTRKIAILMTDGEFNTAYTPGWSSANFAEEICNQMRKDGITIYSVGFQAPTQAEKTLTDCASNANNGGKLFYSASNGAELKAAFADIAKSIQSLRLSR